MSKAVETEQTKALTPVSHALTGSLDELARAADQMGTAMAQLQLNGWNTVQKCKAAFWLAHGSGEHPATFIQNHYIMEIKGRLTVTPRWQYVVRKLNETIPGFLFKIVHNTDDAAKVWMSDGKNSFEYEYTTEDARRVGLFNRSGGNAWTEGSTREMCLARAVKRCGELMGLGRATPWVETEIGSLPDGRTEPSGAEEVGDGGGSMADASEPGPLGGVEGGPAPEPASGKAASAADRGPRPNPIKALSDALVKLYGRQSKAVALEKATLLYNEMVKSETGVDPGAVFKTVDQIGPVDAERIVAFLQKRPLEAMNRAAAEAEQKAAVPEEVAAATAGDEPPMPESAETSNGHDPLQDAYEDFMVVVTRAKKVFGRKFLVEAPAGSHKFWFIDQATFSQAGDTASLKVQDNEEIMLPPEKMRQLARILKDDCDSKERARP